MPRKSNIVVELEQQLAAAQDSWRETTEEIACLEAAMKERIAHLKQQEISYGKAIENYSHLLSVAKSTRIRTAKAKKPTTTATPEAAVSPVPDTAPTSGEPSTTATDATDAR